MQVNYDDLDIQITGNGDHEYFYGGKLYTGSAVELDEQKKVASESNYRSGYQTGTLKIWWPNGQLKHKTEYLFNLKNGESSEWYEKGQIKNEELYEADTLLKSKEYDESGQLIRDYKVERDSPATYQALLDWRKIKAKYAKIAENRNEE
jgi:antitoxin component YwqK of YwqJK toxin-antitoxin module